LQLLRSGGLLWLTNVIVFALWYWRLDGGGPTVRHKLKKFGSTSFLFPQMQIPRDERPEFACARWHPLFIDYLFVAFTQSSTFGPTECTFAGTLGESPGHYSDSHLAHHCHPTDRARGGRAVVHRR
jgi:hypothetical protein